MGCAALLVATSVPAAAQVFVAPPTPNADRLAVEMRALAANPEDLGALLNAGELSVKLDDPAAALQFFARAEKIDRNNPRIATGRGGALVRLGRPGEALKLFAEAERRGVSANLLAPHRALAYDLIGQPGYAQQEYRRALAAAPGDADLTRAYALSLGISGDSKQAYAALDPLLRDRDRAAWRARAFILAMEGETAEAQQIATNMMPGFGTAFSPFFQQLAQLRDPADRAFAVHRGEIGRTPARMADATMAPSLPPYVAQQPVRMASVDTAPKPKRETRRSRRAERSARVGKRSRGSRTPIASEPAVVVAAATPSPTPAPAPAATRVEVAAAVPTPPAPVGLVLPNSRPAAETRVAVAAKAPAGMEIDPASVVRVAVPNSGEDELRAAAARAVNPIRSTPLVAPAATPSVPVVPPPVMADAPAAASKIKVGSEDDVLASILSGIAIPAEELGVGVAPAPAPVQPEPAKVEIAKAEPAKAEPAKTEPPRTGADEPPAKPAPVKAVAAKKAEAKKAEAKPPSDPARHWVQVAGGANKADLPKEWKRLTGIAPDALKGQSAWTTPLRFTNRLLAGPFKSTQDAQGFVNTLGKEGISAFAWTSDTGQKIEKLSPK